MKKKFALVQWIGGDYDKTYTPGVPVEWILDFNLEKFDPAEEPEDQSYIVQWRESKTGKIPKCGWKYYDAKIVRVSHHIKKLENEMRILEGVMSPLRPVCVREDVELPAQKNLDHLYDPEPEAENHEDNKDIDDHELEIEEVVIASESKSATPGIQYKRKKKNQEKGEKAHADQGQSANHQRKKSRDEPREDKGKDSDLLDTSVNEEGTDKRSVMQILQTLCREVKTIQQVQAQVLEDRQMNQPPPLSDRVWKP
ncbi:uncharacterized protein LOC141537201 [Cotesia typhae]|uniref:uncharacterized protein LOC141537201 n=1 Tax=Cotesia typhae TaxID=2053667 RepID=UPI003D685356